MLKTPYPKRTFDALVSAAALLLLAPLMILIAIAVWLDLGRPVLFTQPRPGLHGRLFRLFKYRTMRPPAPGQSGSVDDAMRLSRFGRFLRVTSLDELPELWNVLRGDMSLVGPRPLLMHYLDHYTPQQMRRHDVRPGLTGWAQVKGRNAISWDEKFAYDVWYVDNVSLWLDLRILFLTLGGVVTGRGVSAEGSATMPEFAPPPAQGGREREE